MRATVMVVEDDAELRQALCDILDMSGYGVAAAEGGAAALSLINEQAVDLVVSDIQMRGLDGHALLRQIKQQQPEIPVLMMTAYGTVESAVQALRDGAADYLIKPFEPEVLITRIEQLIPERVEGDAGAVAVDPKTLELLELARRVAESDATVLITGESGTGKEVLFQYIHRHSPRGARTAVALNCAAIPDNMLEAILFGYEKGAFTGAYKSSPGKFEQAQGSSLLLDEVSEMSLNLQAKLLRVLQEREVERLGGNRITDLDVRVVATSNRDLKAAVTAGEFREDLYYRLNVFPLHIPPLRERRDDIVPLARFLLKRAASNNNQPAPALDADARVALEAYRWPGNVRELDNVMQRARIIHRGDVITAADLYFEAIGQASAVAGAPGVQADNLGGELKVREQRLILEALREGRGSRKLAAEKLGISPRTLRYKLAKMREAGIELP